MCVELIDLYLSNKSNNTRRNYGALVRQWIQHLAAEGKSPQTATAESVIRYVSSLRKAGAAPSTITLRVDALSSIYSFLEDMDIVDKNPVKKAKRALKTQDKHQVRPTKLLDYNRINEIIDSIKPVDRKSVRDRAILAVLFGSGIRRSEAVSLNLENVMITAQGVQYLHIERDKGGSGRDVAMPLWAWDKFSNLVTQRISEGGSSKDPLFVNYSENYSGKRISTYTLYRIYKFHTGAAPHSARATFATALLEQGYHDRDVASALGHMTTKQVQVYDKRVKKIQDSPAIDLDYKKIKKFG